MQHKSERTMQVWPLSVSSVSSTSGFPSLGAGVTVYMFLYVPFWQKLLLTSRACPLSTPVLSANVVIHHVVVHQDSPGNTTIACSHPHLHPSSTLSDWAQSYPSSPHHAPHSMRQPHHSALHFLLPSPPWDSPSLPDTPFPLQAFISLPALQSSKQSWERTRALSPGPVTLVKGTNCPPLLAYTSGKLRTCGGEKVHSVCVFMYVCDKEWERFS